MKFYRYKASFAKDDSGPRFWFAFVTAIVVIFQSFMMVDLFRTSWFLLLGLIIGGLSFSAINVYALRLVFNVYWAFLALTSFILIFFVGFLFDSENIFGHKNESRVFICFFISSMVELIIGNLFFRKFESDI